VVWIAGLFGDREPAGRAKYAAELSEDGGAVDHLAEHGDEEGDVKRLVVERQPYGIGQGEADIPDARAVESGAGPLEHLWLHIEEL
jgi:hypothetical protein